MTLQEFLEKAWIDYSKLTPDAPVIHRLLTDRGEVLINDHVAIRTFNLPGMGRLEIGALFENWGFRRAEEDLDFPDKKLKASYWLHPEEGLPKIFVSELLVEKVSKDLQEWIRDLSSPVRSKFAALTAETLLNRTWDPVSFAQYQRFYPESEYACWTAAFGIRVNHFTVFINSLMSFDSLSELNTFLVQQGMQLNEAGGIIKGSPAEFLEQSSTVAKRVPCEFSGGITESVMGCYYEFAKRYPLPSSEGLFQGFVPKSADKIFESTFERRSN